MRHLLLAALLLLPVAAAAQGEPRLIPGQDVAVTYRLGGAAAERIPGGAPDGVRLEWDAAGQRLRAEALGRPVYAITDLQRRVEQVVFAAQSAVLELPLRMGDPAQMIAGSGLSFTRRGQARVAGEACTEWAFSGRKVSGVGCVAADGVLLRVSGVYDGQQGTAEALHVERGPIPPEQFAPPPGASRIALGTRH